MNTSPGCLRLELNRYPIWKMNSQHMHQKVKAILHLGIGSRGWYTDYLTRMEGVIGLLIRR
jgi:hypothetical protein